MSNTSSILIHIIEHIWSRFGDLGLIVAMRIGKIKGSENLPFVGSLFESSNSDFICRLTLYFCCQFILPLSSLSESPTKSSKVNAMILKSLPKFKELQLYLSLAGYKFDEHKAFLFRLVLDLKGSLLLSANPPKVMVSLYKC